MPIIVALIACALYYFYGDKVTQGITQEYTSPSMNKKRLITFGAVNLPYNPSVFVNDKPIARVEVVNELLYLKKKGYNFTLTGGYGNGHVSPAHTMYATAVDIVPLSPTTEKELYNALTALGFKVLIEGKQGRAGYHLHAEGSSLCQ